MQDRNAIRVLMVCMGNICRSPLAEGVLRHRLAMRSEPLPVEVDSAGTHGYHHGAPPDARARTAALRRGVDIATLRARPVVAEDLLRFDLILAMDEDNHSFLLQMADEEQQARIRLYLEFASKARLRSVPDPYYGGPAGFERVLDLVEDATEGLLSELERLSRERNPGSSA